MKEAGVLGALSNDQGVLIHLLGDHIPWCLFTMREATNTKPLTLTYGVVHQALVLPQYLAVTIFHHPGLCRQVARQEILETTLADKANTGAVLFVVGN